MPDEDGDHIDSAHSKWTIGLSPIDITRVKKAEASTFSVARLWSCISEL